MIHLGIRIEPRRRRKEEEHGGRIAVAAVSFAGRNINTPDEASSKLRLERYSISLTADEPEASARRHAARKKKSLAQMNIYDFSSILAAGGRDGQHTFPPFRIRLRAQHLRSLSTNLFQNGCDFMETSSVFFFRFLN